MSILGRKLWLCPEGNAKYKGHSLSIFLVSVDSESSTTEHEVKAEFELTLNDQFKQNHIKKKGNNPSSTFFPQSALLFVNGFLLLTF